MNTPRYEFKRFIYILIPFRLQIHELRDGTI